MNTRDLASYLSHHRTPEGYTFECQHIDGEVQVLQVEMNGFEGFPVFVTSTAHQILCVIYLWTEAEIIPELRKDMLDMMLDTSIAIPLSSYARVGDRYVLFGALSVASDFDRLVEELVTLNENALDVLFAMDDFLR
ncbi:YjfI family protein [Marinicella sediminis]|uniref:YjfI family protein n=1 Tax=Marinicella sediminis TaxID=1792834 RepID=A0ABV7JI07_9GAMM|nr:DUF2170 family protein [Marinicella sediminis]